MLVVFIEYVSIMKKLINACFPVFENSYKIFDWHRSRFGFYFYRYNFGGGFDELSWLLMENQP